MTNTKERDAFFRPLGWSAFEKDILGQRFFHFQGDAKDGRLAFSWEALNTLLSQEGLWTFDTLKLAQNGEILDARQYCHQGLDRQGHLKWLPDLGKVMAWWQQGAGLVCNDTSTLWPSLKRMSHDLAHTFGAQVLANIYATSGESPAFAPHFDTHDVWAFQISGEKTWYLYGQAPNPVNHSLFNDLDKAHHMAHKGERSATLVTKPGDVLYIPRGLYHDACAKEGASLHVTFSVTRPTGLDVISALFDTLLHDERVRADIPMGVCERTDFMARLGEIIGETLGCADVMGSAPGARGEVHTSALPLPTRPQYHLASSQISLCQEGHNVWLVTPHAQVPIPQEWQGVMPWIVAQRSFSQEDLLCAHPSIETGAFQRLLSDLLRMDVLRHGPHVC